MNAVNLAPAGSNRRQRQRPSVSLSTPSLALLGGLLVVLLGTALFVSAHQRVTSRRDELSKLQSGVAQWTAAASGFDGQVQQFTERSRSLASVHQLIAERYHWSQLLSQIAGVTPSDVQLSSLQASTPASTSAADSAAGTTAATTSDGVTVSGCAASHPAVAEAMVSLRRVTGIANVVLSSSAKDGSSATPTSGGAAGGCSLPVQFQLTLVFGASPSATAPATAAASTSSSTGVAQ